MKAMVIVPTDDGGTLELREVPQPQPQAGQVLIRIKATALNRADLYQRRGAYPTPTTGNTSAVTIAGLEAAGEIAGLGEGVTGFTSGERVMMMCFGGYAEYTTVDHRVVVKVPDRLSWEEATAIPVSYLTEHDALITNAKLQPGESVLINAASSGVGIPAIQIAKLFGAAPLIGISGDAGKLVKLRSLGLDHSINYRSENFADAVLKITEGKGVNIIIDHVGASQFQDNLRCLALCGRLISVGRLGGNNSEINLDYLALRRLQLIGVTFRTRTMDERAAIVQRFTTDILPALADGRLKPVIDKVFPFTEALAAQEYLASNAQLGKIVLML
ncbi:MAG: NAD(P)H-quinone oxidoreductase [Candidatus Binatia bacterium]